MGKGNRKLNRRLAVRALALMLALLFAMPSFATMEDLPDRPAGLDAVDVALEPAGATEAEADMEVELADDAPEAGEASPEPDVDADDIAVPEADDAPPELSGEIWLDDLAFGSLSANEEQSPLEESGDKAPAGFHESAAVGDGRVTVTALPGSFPAGATLSAGKSDDEAVARLCEATLAVEGCTHRLYSIEVLDAAGNAILPDYDMELPVARVDGIDTTGDTRVFYYDWVERAVFELAATIDESGSAVEFAFLDSALYDIVTLPVSEDAGDAAEPTEDPAAEPTEAPTAEPDTEPTEEPDAEPAIELPEEPTVAPTEEPTAEAGGKTVEEPSEEPTVELIDEPLGAPTAEPTIAPTEEPTSEPTAEPTAEPTLEPTVEPAPESTVEPTAEPITEPTVDPTIEPTAEPTLEPTTEPVVEPTAEPTVELTIEPTVEPTPQPTTEPTAEPTAEPTEEPTVAPMIEPTIEPTVPPVAYPAQRFTAAVEGIAVLAEAPEGAFPEGTTLRVTPVWDDSTLSDIETAVSGDFVEVKRIHAVDITFLDADGAEIEPLVPISVVLTLEEMTRQQEAVVVHVDDDGNAAVVERAEEPEVAFEAESFSVYALVVTEAVEQVVKASDGRDYRITVAYSPDAGIPDGATLSVAEITDADACAAYAAEAAAAMGMRASSIGYGRLFDITILAEGEAVQPRAGATVDVRVTLADADGADVSVVHFARAPESVEADTDGDTVAFTTGGFSVYGFFTVDFWYGEYEYHLPGEGEILLSELFALLGIEDSAANAQSVTFTAPQYLSIRQLEDDWKLISLAPFDTEETLTVKFPDGEISVRVTDAEAYTYNFNVNDTARGVVYQSSSKYGDSLIGGAVANGGLSSWSIRPSSVSNPTSNKQQAENGSRFVWWSYDGTSRYTTYRVDHENEKMIQPNTGKQTTFTANFAPENEHYIMYAAEASGSISGERSFETTSGYQYYSYLGDTTGATVTYTDAVTFLGWYDEAGNLLCSDDTFDLSTATTDMVVTAKFKAKVVINYSSNNTNQGTVNISTGYKGETGATANGEGSKGFKFDYWLYNGTQYTNNPFDTSVVTEESGTVNVVAYFVATPRVTLSSNNVEWGKILHGTDNWSNNQTIVTDADGTLRYSVTATPENGFEFSHWVINGTDSHEYAANKADTIVFTQANNTLQAVFKPEGSYALTFEAEAGGTVNIASDYTTTNSYSASGVTAIPDTDYVFMGWYIGDTLFSNKAQLEAADLATEKFTGDTTLTARFYPPVTINYKAKGDGKASPETETVAFGAAAMGSTATPDNANQRFVCWMDDNGNTVSTVATFKPTYTYPTGENKTLSYTAVFEEANNVYYTTNDYDLVKRMARYGGGVYSHDVLGFITSIKTVTLNIYSKIEENGSTASQITASTDPQFVRWELTYADNKTDYVTNSPSINPNNSAYKTNSAGSVLTILKAVVKPRDTYIVNYSVQTGDTVGDTSGGNISNTTDYAGSPDARGCVATKNTASDKEFLGWFLVNADGSLGERLSTATSISAGELTTWVNNHKITEDFTQIRAYFGEGFTVTYQQKLGDEAATELYKEFITTDDPKTRNAEALAGYNFAGWYVGETLVSESAQLMPADLVAYTANRKDFTVTATYTPAHKATYQVRFEGQIPVSGVSRYGTVNVNGAIASSEDAPVVQTANKNNLLVNSASAVALRGCEFTGWTVTDADGNPITIDGVDISAPNIPQNIDIDRDVVFTANFKKQEGAVEIVYTIEKEQDRGTYGASLTVGTQTVSGTETATAYISEVVPKGENALGCTAEGIELDVLYQIMGWALGKSGDSGRDRLVSPYKTFVPDGEYLSDVDGTGYRYFRVIPKWEQNTYIQLKVSEAAAGDYTHGGTTQTNNLIFINNRTRKTGDLGGDADAYKTTLADYHLSINAGYKLVGFTYNGEELELATPITGSGSITLTADNTAITPVTVTSKHLKDEVTGEAKTVTVDNLLDFIYHTSVFRDVDGTIERSLNVLMANYEQEAAYNIRYHIKEGSSGQLSNLLDTFKESERETATLTGCTVTPDYDNDYVFVRWEDADGNPVTQNGVAVGAQFIPDKDAITDSNITYHYYAVLEQRPKLTIVYESEDPLYGDVSLATETVYKGMTPVGSTASAYTGYEFVNWTLEDDTNPVSDAEAFRPSLNDSDFPAIGVSKTITYVAHFEGLTTLTVNKTVAVAAGDALDKSSISTEIYITLTDSDGRDVLNSENQVWAEKLIISGGEVVKTAVFKGLPYGKYNVWENYRDGSAYKPQYVGYLVKADCMVYNISGSNNAELSATQREAEVSFTNTYSTPQPVENFVVHKKWLDGAGNTAPADAEVVFSLYSKKDERVTLIKSITLNGEVDGNGETAAWTATFSGLQQLPEGYSYAVRETRGYDGYTAYHNNSAMTENTYVTNTGGTITNTESGATVSLAIDKTVTGRMGDWDRAFAFTLSGLADVGAYPFQMYSTTDGTRYDAMTGAGDSGTLTADGGAVTFNLKHRQRIVIGNLPPNATLTVAEQNANYTTTWALDGTEQAATSGSGTSTVRFDMPASDANLAVTNNLEPVSPTGVRARNGPYLLMLLLAVAMLAARRRRGHRKRGGADG